MKMNQAAVSVLFLALTAPSLPQSKRGEDALYKKDFVSAEKIFRDDLQANANSGQSWFGLGDALYGEQKFPDAAEAYHHAAGLNFQTIRAQFRETKSLTRAGEKDRAFEILTELNRQGFPNLNALKNDPDLVPLRSDNRWPP
jgi:tetratricopeptide (TPR) repeat protein